MAFHLTSFGKHLETIRAFEWLFSGVSPNVPFQTVSFNESFRTEIASEKVPYTEYITW